jgi:hypothetical protein
MTTMNLNHFLKEHKSKDKAKITHTRIPDKENKIYGGSFTIEGDDEAKFYDLVYREVVDGSKLEYLTEVQLKNDVAYLDVDFRYLPEVTTRQHNDDWIENVVAEYTEALKSFLVFDDTPFRVYVCHKDGVNRTSDKTKDGIHIIFLYQSPQ